MTTQPGDGRGRRVPDPKTCQRLAEQMLALALKAGADGAEVLVRDGTELEVKVRLGEPELIKEAGSRALGLRVIKDERAAVTYTSDLTAAGMERFARDSVELAALAEPDPVAALPARDEMARDVPELDLWDESVLSVDVAEGIRRARAGEAAALAFDKRVTNSDGAVFGRDGRRVGVCDVGRVFGIGARYACVARRRAAVRRRRRKEAERVVLDRVALRHRARRTPRRSASRPRAARSRSWARARSRRARHR